MKRFPLLITSTATFWGTLPENAENIKAVWYGQKLEVGYTVNGVACRGYVSPSVTSSPEQVRNLLAIRTK